MKIFPLTVIAAIITVLILVLPIYVKYAVKDEIYNQSITIPKKIICNRSWRRYQKNGKPGSFLKQRLDDSVELYNKGIIKKVLVCGDNG